MSDGHSVAAASSFADFAYEIETLLMRRMTRREVVQARHLYSWGCSPAGAFARMFCDAC